MPSGLAESPNTGGGLGNDGGYDSGPGYDANNPTNTNDPMQFANLPPTRRNDDGTPNFGLIYNDLNNLGDNGSTYDVTYPSYDVNSPTVFSDPTQWANLPPAYDGKNGSLDFQKAALDALDTGDNYGKGDEGFWGSEFGKNLKKFGLFALQMHPATRGPMALYNAYNAFSNGQYGQGLGTLIGGVTGNPLAGAAGGLVGDAVAGRQVSGNTMGQFTGGLGSMMGGQVAGAPGAFLGGQFGRQLGQNMANNAGQPGQGGSAIGQGDFARTNYTNPQQLPQQQRTAIPKTGEMSGTDAAINGLAALYMYNRQNGMDKEQAARQAQLMQQQQQMMQTYMEQAAGVAPEMREPDFGSVYAKMDEMYAPGGNIAKELRTVLERKDAASGRRSQYGPREVELLSRLAQMRSQYEPAYLNAAAQEANAANQMAMADANARRAALQAAMQGQSGNYNAQAQALAAQQAREAARMQRDQQLLNTIYTVGSGSNWWGLGDMWNNGGS